MSDYIEFVDERPSKSGKTRIWTVISWRKITLGEIRWYAQWRRYTYYPNDGSAIIYDADCLQVLSDFCRERTHEHLT